MNELEAIKEGNLRSEARGEYMRWVYHRFQKIHLMEITDEPDPIALRRIYVEPLLDEKDRRDAEMVGPEKLDEEEEHGRGLWELLEGRPFLMISGKPGSGKTTLVSRTVLELADPETISDFSLKLDPKNRILPIPLTLRSYDFSLIETLDDLLDAWWIFAEYDARPVAKEERLTAQQENPMQKRYMVQLDVARLKASVQEKTGPEDTRRPTLLLFDGIDEVGGPETRTKVLGLAFEAFKRGYRVLLTGRPGGFTDLDLPELCKGYNCEAPPLVYLQPFLFKQVETFVNKWYRLRDDWRRKSEKGVRDFLTALRDSQRPFLLSLARRPIFLTLMSLVHLNRNAMPDGRASLYEEIIDLYLKRQDRHRQLKHNAAGTKLELDHWPDAEKRLVLGFLAWRSQCRGSEEAERLTPFDDSAQARQLIWSKQELLAAVTLLLSGSKHGRFTTLKPADTEALLSYFLHPAGLLVQPAEDKVQFAHLSFQEYLCAEYLQGRYSLKGDKFLKKELLAKLALSGWDEVAMLFMTIHAAKTQNEGHFQVLDNLEIAEVHQANLLVQALAGGELSFKDAERLEYLPLAAGASLLHPNWGFPRTLALRPALIERLEELLVELLRTTDTKHTWDVLALRSDKFENQKAATQRWQEPANDSSWNIFFGPHEARCQALLWLIITILPSDDWKTEATTLGKRLDDNLARLLAEAMKADSHLLWQRHNDEEWQQLPYPTTTCFLAETVAPRDGSILNLMGNSLPARLYALDDEAFVDETFVIYYWGEPLIPVNLTLSLNPRVSASLKDSLIGFGYGIGLLANNFGLHYFKRAQALALARAQAQAQALALALAQAQALALTRARARAQALALALALARALARALELMQTLALRQIAAFGRSSQLRPLCERAAKKVEETDTIPETLIHAAAHFAYRFAVHDWFVEMAEDPDLLARRGFPPKEPLPKHLGILDEDGRLRPTLRRDSLEKLHAFLTDHEGVLDWLRPEGIDPDERERLLADQRDLEQAPWSPHAGIASALAEWPEGKEEIPFTVEAAEEDLIQALKDFLEES
ncbi:MAG: hypothetical protein QNK37_07530 [Acidobacteriota bacterium]|nr:hypothetical protein [Acidobacteriota bacterium]